MPWKETNVVDERLNFIIKAFDKNTNFLKLCNEYGITTKTGYKWKKRFIEGGMPSLEDQSRRPLSNSRAIPTDMVCQIIRIKVQKISWGPKKIHATLKNRYPDREIPSLSSVARVLEKSGYTSKRKKRRINKTNRIQNRIKATEPNQIWTVDFKGWWYTTVREKCEPLTIRDDFSKFILSIKILEKGDISHVKAEFEKVFKKYGTPEFIRSDNGPPFASAQAQFGLTQLSAWWLSLGIRLDRIDPGKPYQNGSHERMHLDMMNELERKIEGDLKLHQSVFDVWRKEFNTERPHESLDMKTPSQVYVKSNRKFRPVNTLVYPKDFLSRQVNNRGYTLLKGRKIFLSNAFNGFNVGFEGIKNPDVKVWFANHILGEVNQKTFHFTPNENLVTVINT